LARIVSINPTIVIVRPCRHREYTTYDHRGRGYTHLECALQWFSPDLKKGPIDIKFTEDGVAEIPLRKGKLRLVREDEICQVTRE
jgi:hypothetical protein